MKKLFIIILTLSISICSISQTQTFYISKIEIRDPNAEGRWDQLMTYSKINLHIDGNKNIYFEDDPNMRLMSILAGSKYVSSYSNISYINKELMESDKVKSFDSYIGTINLNGKNNFTISDEASVFFWYFPGTNNVRVIEIRNRVCMCYVRLWIEKVN
jgi:hypothetical protein